MKAETVHFIQVAEIAVGHDADTAEPLVNRGHDFPDECSRAGWIIQILQHQHSRFRDSQAVLPEVAAGSRARCRFLSGESRGDRIACHHAQIGKQRPNLRRHEPLVAWADIK